jgi:hypothetical protein
MSLTFIITGKHVKDMMCLKTCCTLSHFYFVTFSIFIFPTFITVVVISLHGELQLLIHSFGCSSGILVGYGMTPHLEILVYISISFSLALPVLPA